MVVDYVVELRNITKKFGVVTANRNVNLNVVKGEVLALVGENGAGKTTLMNVLYGLHMPTSGDIVINGKTVVLKTALDAIEHGIGMVHQHFMLIPRLSVVENIVLGSEPKRGVFFDKQKALQDVAAVCQTFKLDIDLNVKVKDISLGMQQRVEIIKTLYRGADIIILDEPTAVLTPKEIDELGEILKHLKQLGKTVIIITHKMEEILNFSDRVAVLRQGENAGELLTSETDAQAITRLMVGRDVQLGGHKEQVSFEETVLSLEAVSLPNGRLQNISFQLKKGEILGIAGIDGSGQTELAEVIAGLHKHISGTVCYQGQPINAWDAKKRKSSGISFIPRDRHKDGLVLPLTIEENLVLGLQREASFVKGKHRLNFKAIHENALQKVSDYDIRCSSEKQTCGTLSGGNQQKVIVAREIGEQTKLILADQPTRGIDVGAIAFIHNVLTQKRNQGCGIVLVSLELDELLMLSDRVLVMAEGGIAAILDTKDATRDRIGELMISKRKEVE